MNGEPLPNTTEFIFICQLLHVCMCVFVAATPSVTLTHKHTHAQAGYWGTGQVQLQLDMKGCSIVAFDYVPVKQIIKTVCFCDGCLKIPALMCFKNEM